MRRLTGPGACRKAARPATVLKLRLRLKPVYAWSSSLIGYVARQLLHSSDERRKLPKANWAGKGNSSKIDRTPRYGRDRKSVPAFAIFLPQVKKHFQNIRNLMYASRHAYPKVGSVRAKLRVPCLGPSKTSDLANLK